MLGRVATVRGDTNVRGMIRRTGGQRHGKGIQRRREALAAAFQVRLLLRPTAEESLGAKIARERGDLVGFGRRKKAARDLVAFDFRPHVFQVDADVGVDGDGDAIGADVVQLINQVYDANTAREPWRPGDLMLVDNVRTAHGREPFEGPREVLVAMADALRLADGSPTAAGNES